MQRRNGTEQTLLIQIGSAMGRVCLKLRLIRKSLEPFPDLALLRVPVVSHHQHKAFENTEDCDEYGDSDYKIHRFLLSNIS